MKRFGVGRPFSVSREPSVPPRISVPLRLEADAGGSPRRRLSTISGAWSRAVLHVPVLHRRPRRCTSARGSERDHLVGERAQPLDVLLELRVVVVADDERQLDLGIVAADHVRMDEALALLGRLGRQGVPRQARDEVGRQLDRVDELALRRRRGGSTEPRT